MAAGAFWWRACARSGVVRAAITSLPSRRWAVKFPDVRFAWIDVEDEPEVAGDIDIDNFPTLVIQHDSHVLFCGAMLPHISQLERLLQTLLLRKHSLSRMCRPRPLAERVAWQSVADIRSRLMLLS